MLSIIRKLEDNIEFTYDKDRADMARKQIELIHRDDDGFIAIAAQRNKSFLQYHYKYDTLIKNIKKTVNIDANLYITANSFFKPSRTIESIRKLNALYIDLDYYKIEKYKDYTAEEMIEVLEEKYFGESIPKPTMITSTGRGLGIYWAINNLPYMALPLWSSVQKYILYKLKPVGADSISIDASRLLRLCGTTNLKSKKGTYIIYSNESTVYNLRELQKRYLPILTKKKAKVKKHSSSKEGRIISFYNLHNLHFARLKDLVKLVEMRNGFCRNNDGVLVQKGSREKLVFLYRYWSCCYISDPKVALENTLEFNSKFDLPLTEAEVESATRSAEEGYKAWLEYQEKNKDKLKNLPKKSEFNGYNYSNERLIKMLNITEEEMEELITIISKDEKRRRDREKKRIERAKRREKEGLTAKQRELKELREEIKKLRKEGYSIRMIGKKLGVSASKVQRNMKE